MSDDIYGWKRYGLFAETYGDLPDDKEGTLRTWLDPKNGKESVKGKYLLAHSYGGVVWGYYDDNKWHLSADKTFNSYALAQPFDTHTLLQLRIFDEAHELFIWREADGLHGRTLTDGGQSAETIYYRDETQILWGTAWKERVDQFTILSDGQQHLYHAFPMIIPDDHFDAENLYRPARLCVRHYAVIDEETGLTRIKYSRLVTVKKEKPDGS